MIEADFQREYAVNLVSELPRMSWRRFLVLLNNLSADSVFVLTNRDDPNKPRYIEDDTEAERYMDSIF